MHSNDSTLQSGAACDGMEAAPTRSPGMAMENATGEEESVEAQVDVVEAARKFLAGDALLFNSKAVQKAGVESAYSADAISK